MVTIDGARKMALHFAEVEEHPHFDKPSFRVRGKIFSTLWEEDNRIMLRLTPVDQSVFVSFDQSVFYPFPGKWGLKGATLVELKKVKKEMLLEAMTLSYKLVAPKELADKY